MTENEAIKHLQSYAEVVDNMIKYCKDFEPKADITGYLEKKTVFAMAISAIKEVQQYREIGAVKECRKSKDFEAIVRSRSSFRRVLDEWHEYESIGTVEECRRAVEKQKAKKPDIYTDTRNMVDLHGNVYAEQANVYLCPTCESFIGYVGNNIFPYCPVCGQAIDENLEGMEDE